MRYGYNNRVKGDARYSRVQRGRFALEKTGKMTSIREAKDEDLDCLAEMAYLLIEDEGHCCTLNVPELKERMKEWLLGE